MKESHREGVAKPPRPPSHARPVARLDVPYGNRGGAQGHSCPYRDCGRGGRRTVSPIPIQRVQSGCNRPIERLFDTRNCRGLSNPPMQRSDSTLRLSPLSSIG